MIISRSRERGVDDVSDNGSTFIRQPSKNSMSRNSANGFAVG